MQDIDGVFNSANAKGTFGAHDGAFETSLPGTANPTDLLDSTDKDMLDAKYWEISMYKSALEGRKGELADGEVEKDDDSEVQIGNKLRRDAFLVFRALCKLSMKTPPKEDPELMRGKIVALELLKILLENAGAVFRTSDRFVFLILFPTLGCVVCYDSSENWLHFAMKQVLRRHQAVSVSLLAEKQCLKSYDHFPAFLLDFT